MVLGTWGELRVGPVWQRIKAQVDTGLPLLPHVQENSAGLAFRLVGDHLDHAWIAREGHRAILSAYVADKSFGSTQNYKRLEGRLDLATSFGAHTLNLGMQGGTNLGSNLPAYETFTLGGPLRLSGYHINEFSGRSMAFGRLLYYNRAVKLPDLLGSGVYLGGSLEAGRVKDRFDATADPGTLYSASAFLAADSFMGPGYFGVGVGKGGRLNVYLILGVP